MSFVSGRFAGIIQDEKLQNKNRVPFLGLCFCYSSSGYPGMYVSESRGSADKPHLVFSKPSGCKPCTQSGECSGENSADGQHRQINKNTCRAKDHHGDTDLTEVMEKGTDHTDKRDVLFPEQPKEQCHGHETEQTAAQAVGEGYHLPDHHAGDQDTHQKYAQSILPGSIIQKPQRNDIGKSQLDPGDRGERRQHCLHHKNRQGNGRVHCQKRHMFYFHTKLHSVARSGDIV